MGQRRILSPSSKLPTYQPAVPLDAAPTNTELDREAARNQRDAEREARMQEREDAAAQKDQERAQLHERNNVTEADLRTRGVKQYTDADSVIRPQLDPLTGKEQTLDMKGAVEYDQNGEAFQMERKAGKWEQTRPDAGAKIGPNPDDPNDPGVYKQNKEAPWQYIDPNEGVNSDDPAVRSESAKKLQQVATRKQKVIAAQTEIELSKIGRPPTPKQLAEAQARITNGIASDEDKATVQRDAEHRALKTKLAEAKMEDLRVSGLSADEFLSERKIDPVAERAALDKMHGARIERLKAIEGGLMQERQAIDAEATALAARAQTGVAGHEMPALAEAIAASRIKQQAWDAKMANFTRAHDAVKAQAEKSREAPKVAEDPALGAARIQELSGDPAKYKSAADDFAKRNDELKKEEQAFIQERDARAATPINLQSEALDQNHWQASRARELGVKRDQLQKDAEALKSAGAAIETKQLEEVKAAEAKDPFARGARVSERIGALSAEAKQSSEKIAAMPDGPEKDAAIQAHQADFGARQKQILGEAQDKRKKFYELVDAWEAPAKRRSAFNQANNMASEGGREAAMRSYESSEVRRNIDESQLPDSTAKQWRNRKAQHDGGKMSDADLATLAAESGLDPKTAGTMVEDYNRARFAGEYSKDKATVLSDHTVVVNPAAIWNDTELESSLEEARKLIPDDSIRETKIAEGKAAALKLRDAPDFQISAVDALDDAFPMAWDSYAKEHAGQPMRTVIEGFRAQEHLNDSAWASLLTGKWGSVGAAADKLLIGFGAGTEGIAQMTLGMGSLLGIPGGNQAGAEMKEFGDGDGSFTGAMGRQNSIGSEAIKMGVEMLPLMLLNPALSAGGRALGLGTGAAAKTTTAIQKTFSTVSAESAAKLVLNLTEQKINQKAAQKMVQLWAQGNYEGLAKMAMAAGENAGFSVANKAAIFATAGMQSAGYIQLAASDAYRGAAMAELIGDRDPESIPEAEMQSIRQQAMNSAAMKARPIAGLAGVVTGLLTTLLPKGAESMEALALPGKALSMPVADFVSKIGMKSLGQYLKSGTVMAGISSFLVTMGINVADETIEEFSDELFQNLLAKATYDPTSTFGDAFAAALHAGGLGGLMGGVGGFAGSVNSYKEARAPQADAKVLREGNAAALATMDATPAATIMQGVSGHPEVGAVDFTKADASIRAAQSRLASAKTPEEKAAAEQALSDSLADRTHIIKVLAGLNPATPESMAAHDEEMFNAKENPAIAAEDVLAATAAVKLAQGGPMAMDQADLAALGLTRDPSGKLKADAKAPTPDGMPRVVFTAEGRPIFTQGFLNRTATQFPATGEILPMSEMAQRVMSVPVPAAKAPQKGKSGPGSAPSGPQTADSGPVQAESAPQGTYSVDVPGRKPIQVTAESEEDAVHQVRQMNVGAIQDGAATLVSESTQQSQGASGEESSIPPAAAGPVVEQLGMSAGEIAERITQNSKDRSNAARKSHAAMAQGLAKALNRWRKVFPAIRIGDAPESGGLQTKVASGLLVLDFAKLAETAGGVGSNAEAWGRAVVLEEVIHRLGLILEAEGKWDAVNLWNKVQEEAPGLAARARSAYDSTVGTPEEQAQQQAHELIRMILQDELTAEQVTELNAAPGVMEEVRKAIMALLDYLADLVGNLKKEGASDATISMLTGVVDEIKARLAAIESPETQTADQNEQQSESAQLAGPVAEQSPEPAAGKPAETPTTTNNGQQTEEKDGQGQVSNEQLLTPPAAPAAEAATPAAAAVPSVAVNPQGTKPVVDQKDTALSDKLGLPAGAVGNPSAVTQNKKRAVVRFAVVELDDMIPSHTFRGEVVKGYDQTLQPRDRSLPEYQKQAQNIGRNLSFEQAAFFPETDTPATTADLGAPVITQDYQVVIGNGRTIGINFAYTTGEPAAARYKSDLQANAAAFGVNPEAVAKMKRPVLVRVIDQEITHANLVILSKESNKGAAMGSNAVEVAAEDAGVITPEILAMLDPNYDLDANVNEEFRKAYIQRVILGRSGKSSDGVNEVNLTEAQLLSRIRQGIFASAFGLNGAGRAALDRMAGDTDDSAKKITKGLLAIAGPYAWMRGEIAAGTLQDMDISQEIGLAAQTIAIALRDRGKSTARAVYASLEDQQEMPGFTSDLKAAVQSLLLRERSSSGRVAHAFSNYVAAVQSFGDPRQMDMFGAPKLPTPLELFTEVTSSERLDADEDGHAIMSRALTAAVENPLGDQELSRPGREAFIASYLPPSPTRTALTALHNEIASVKVGDSVGPGQNQIMHVTLGYGVKDGAMNKAAAALRAIGPISATIKGLAIIKGRREHVVALLEGEKLSAVGAAMKPFLKGAREFTPHITIAVVKNGEGQKYLSDKSLLGMPVTMDSAGLVPAEATKQNMKTVHLTERADVLDHAASVNDSFYLDAPVNDGLPTYSEADILAHIRTIPAHGSGAMTTVSVLVPHETIESGNVNAIMARLRQAGARVESAWEGTPDVVKLSEFYQRAGVLNKGTIELIARHTGEPMRVILVTAPASVVQSMRKTPGPAFEVGPSGKERAFIDPPAIATTHEESQAVHREIWAALNKISSDVRAVGSGLSGIAIPGAEDDLDYMIVTDDVDGSADAVAALPFGFKEEGKLFTDSKTGLPYRKFEIAWDKDGYFDGIPDENKGRLAKALGKSDIGIVASDTWGKRMSAHAFLRYMDPKFKEASIATKKAYQSVKKALDKELGLSKDDFKKHPRYKAWKQRYSDAKFRILQDVDRQYGSAAYKDYRDEHVGALLRGGQSLPAQQLLRNGTELDLYHQWRGIQGLPVESEILTATDPAVRWKTSQKTTVAFWNAEEGWDLGAVMGALGIKGGQTLNRNEYWQRLQSLIAEDMGRVVAGTTPQLPFTDDLMTYIAQNSVDGVSRIVKSLVPEAMVLERVKDSRMGALTEDEVRLRTQWMLAKPAFRAIVERHGKRIPQNPQSSLRLETPVTGRSQRIPAVGGNQQPQNGGQKSGQGGDGGRNAGFGQVGATAINSRALAPNGEKSNLSEHQWKQVRTPAFKRWFGDWENNPGRASKVLDENGEPLVVWHGTDTDFDTFQMAEFGKTDGGWYGRGFYFAGRKEEANAYAESQAARSKKSKRVVPVFLNIRDPFITDHVGQNPEPDERGDGTLFYDYLPGYKHAYETPHELVVYSSNQIKSATDNNGEFNPESDSVLNSRRISSDQMDLFGSYVETLPLVEQTPKGVAARVKKELPPAVAADLFAWGQNGPTVSNEQTDIQPGSSRPSGGKPKRGTAKKPGGSGSLWGVAGENDLFDFAAGLGGTGLGGSVGPVDGSGGRGDGSLAPSGGVDGGADSGDADSSGGLVQSGDSGGVGGNKPSVIPQPEAEEDRNARIDSSVSLVPKSQAGKIAANFEVIALMRQLSSEGRNPTAEEKEVLLTYSGWGHSKQVFDDAMAARFAAMDEWIVERIKQMPAEEARRTYSHRPKNRITGEEGYTPYEIYNWNKNWGEIHARLKDEFSAEEYAAANRSVLNAHYTTPEVIMGKWKIAEKLGFIGGKALEPGAGIGHYIGTQPEHLAERTSWSAVELDTVTAKILALLYPQVRVNSVSPKAGREISGQGFEEALIPNNSQDLVFSNVPFYEKGPWQSEEQYKMQFNLHNYFFARALQKVKPGGIVGFITSSSTMENNPDQRKWLAAHGDLVVAVRLPNTAFKENAGTEVTTDIIFLRKPDGRKIDKKNWIERKVVGRGMVTMQRNLDKTINQYLKGIDLAGVWQDPQLAEAMATWLAARDAESDETPEGLDANAKREVEKARSKVSSDAWAAYVSTFERIEGRVPTRRLDIEVPIRVNEYFADNPGHVFGVHSLAGSMYGAGEYTLNPDPNGPTLEERFAALVAELPENIMGQESAVPSPESKDIERGDQKGSYVEREGQVWRVGDDALEPVDWTFPQIATFRSWSKVLNDLIALINSEANFTTSSEKIESLRAALNASYDAHVSRYGAMTMKGKNAMHGHLEDDPMFDLTASLESAEKFATAKGKIATRYLKADIFRTRMNKPLAPPTKAEDLPDAILQSMMWMGYPNVPYMAKLLGKHPEAIEAALADSDLAFLDPESGLYTDRDSYLTGHVQGKLDFAIEAAQSEPAFEKNVEALKKALPERQMLGGIGISLASSWIPENVRNAYLEQLGIEGADVTYQREGNLWEINGEGSVEQFATQKIDTLGLLRHALEQTEPMLTTTEGRGRDRRTVPDPAGTALAKTKLKALKEDFVKWAKTTDAKIGDKAVGSIIEDTFNKVCNGHVQPKMAGEHITLPGASEDVYRSDVRRGAIARMLSEGSGLIAHGVGFGKTYTLIGLAMELKRLGKANRPMIVVENATLSQFTASFRVAYPTARLLVADKNTFSEKNRKRFIAQIATGNYDCIVIPHSSFNLIPNTEDAINNYIDAQIMELEIARGQIDKRDRRAVAALEGAKVNLENSRMKLIAKLKKRQGGTLAWEELGVDALLVDEAHRYKNAPVITRMKNLKNLPTSAASQRAIGMTLKTLNIQGRMGGRGVFFATGTPISNTIAEAYIMMRYTSPHILEQQKIYNFDQFAAQYATTTVAVESNWKGALSSETRFAKYVNGTALLQMIGSSWDIQMDPDVAGIKRPEMKGGTAGELRLVEPGPANKAFNSWIINSVARQWDDPVFWQNLGGRKQALEDNPWMSAVPIMTMQAGIAAALDIRLVDSNASDDPGSKINLAVKDILETYKATEGRLGTQAVFSDLRNDFSMDHLVSFAGDPGLSDEGITAELDDEGNAVDGDKKKKKAKKFDVFNDLKAKLVKGVAGPDGAIIKIPASQIAIISSGMKADRRAEIFAMVNSGEIRVVLGSSDTMGVGVNIQERLAKMHHLMPPRDFKPSTMEQRTGRILRQGNMHYDMQIEAYVSSAEKTLGKSFRKDKGGRQVPDIKAAKAALEENPEGQAKAQAALDEFLIESIQYAMERSIDSPVYSMMASKQRGAVQLLMGRAGNNFEDPSDSISMGMAEIAARTIGDPDLIRMVELDRDIRGLQSEYEGWLEDASMRAGKLRQLEWNVDYYKTNKIPTAKVFAKAMAPIGADESKETVWEFAGTKLDRNRPKDAPKGWVAPRLIESLDAFLSEESAELAKNTLNKTRNFPLTVDGVELVIQLHQSTTGQAEGLVGWSPPAGASTYLDGANASSFKGAQSLVQGVSKIVRYASKTVESYEQTLTDSEKKLAVMKAAPEDEFEHYDKLEEMRQEHARLLESLANANPSQEVIRAAQAVEAEAAREAAEREARPVAPVDPELATPEVMEVLRRSSIEGNELTLPENLERKLYLKVNAALESAGGKWDKVTKTHLFTGPMAEALGIADADTERDITQREQRTPEEDARLGRERGIMKYKTKGDVEGSIANSLDQVAKNPVMIAKMERLGITPDELYVAHKTGNSWYRQPTHKHVVANAIDSKKPVSSKAVTQYKLNLSDGYVRRGALQVFDQAAADAMAPEAPAPKEYAYALRQRPFGIGAQPPGHTRLDEGDERGRYGVVYYAAPLSDDSMRNYELKRVFDTNQKFRPIEEDDLTVELIGKMVIAAPGLNPVEVSTYWRDRRQVKAGGATYGIDGMQVQDDAGEEAQAEGGGGAAINSRPLDKKTAAQLENGPKATRYRAMALIDGKLYPPMSTSVDGGRRSPEPIGEWMQAEERPDLVPETGRNAGKFRLKGPNGADVWAIYAPYFHSSQNPLNDQFSAAYKKPLVTVEIEIPAKDTYNAEGSKRAVGEHKWAGGRVVSLSRYAKIKRIVPDSEVAQLIAKSLPRGATVADNVVTPSLRLELQKAGVEITESGLVPASSAAINSRAIGNAEFGFVDDMDAAANKIKRSLVRFASGMSSIFDAKVGTHVRGGYDNYGVGFDVGLLSNPGIDLIAHRIINMDTQVFIDSGAFSHFKRGLKDQAEGRKGKPLDFDAIFKKYDDILTAISRVNAVERTDYPRPLLVMPDIIGDQEASLTLVEKYKDQIAVETSLNRATPIIPIPLGKLSLSEAYSRIVEILNSNTVGAKIDPSKFIVGIPSNAEAVSKEALAKFLVESKPRRVHFLGAAADSKLGPLLSVVARNSPDTLVTADASKVRSAILNGVANGKTREQAIIDALVEEDDPESVLNMRDQGSDSAINARSFSRMMQDAGVDLDKLDELTNWGQLGNPDRSLSMGPGSPADPLISSARAYHDETHKQMTDEELNAEARRIVEDDYEGTLAYLVDLAYEMGGNGTLSGVMNKAAQLIMEEESRKPLTQERQRLLQALSLSYYLAGSNQSEAFRARRDPFKTPEQRHREALANLIMLPPTWLRKQFKKADSAKKRKLLEYDASTRIARIEAAFSKMGLSIEEVLNGEVSLGLVNSAAANAAVDTLPAEARAAIRLVQKQEGTKEDVLKATGMTEAQIRQAAAAARAAFIADGLRRAKLAAQSAALSAQPIKPTKEAVIDYAAMAKMTPEEQVRYMERLADMAGLVDDATLWKRKAKKVKLFTPAKVMRRMPDYEPVPSKDGGRPTRGLQQSLQFGAFPPPENQGQTTLTGAGDSSALDPSKPNFDAPRVPPVGSGSGKTGPVGVKIPGTDRADPVADALGKLWVDPAANVSVRVGADMGNIEDMLRLARIAQAADAGGLDMVKEYWVNNILSGPMTQVANISGNALSGAWEFTFQRGFEALWNAFAFRDPNSPQLGEMKYILAAMSPAAANASALMAKAWRTESDFFRHDLGQGQKELFETGVSGEKRKIAIGGKTGRVVRVPGRALMAMDGWFKGMLGTMEAAAQAYRIAKAEGLAGAALQSRVTSLTNTPGSQAWMLAIKKAEELVFQNDLPEYVKIFQQFVNSTKIGSFVFPFIKTPFNIMRAGIRKSPLGLFNLVYHMGKTGLVKIGKGGSLEATPTPKMIQYLAEQTLSFIALAAIFGAAAGDDDDDKKKFFISGSPPRNRGQKALAEKEMGGGYVIRIGGVEINYGRYEPVATVLGTMIDGIKAFKSGMTGPQVLSAIMDNFKGQVMNKSFLSGIAGIIDGLENEGKWSEKMRSAFLQGIVPNLVRQPLRASDANQRDYSDADWWYPAWPSAGNAGTPLIDPASGEERLKGGNALSRALVVPVAPRGTLTDADRTILAWNKENPLKAWAPPAYTKEFTYSPKSGSTPSVKVELNENHHRFLQVRTATLAQKALAGKKIEANQEGIDEIRKAYESAHRQVTGELRMRPLATVGTVK